MGLKLLTVTAVIEVTHQRTDLSDSSLLNFHDMKKKMTMQKIDKRKGKYKENNKSKEDEEKEEEEHKI